MGCGSSSTNVVPEGQVHQEAKGTTRRPLETRILQDEIVDTCVNREQPNEARTAVLQEGEFIDGMLGLVFNEGVMTEMVERLTAGDLFKDLDFPADTPSLSFANPDKEEFQDIIWLRPHELSEDPHLFVDGVSRSDVKQGILGDCWFLSACAAVAKRPDLMEKIVLPGQVLSGEDYKGLIIISFWRFGQWVKVHIDDRLPVRNSALVYASCTNPNEFWLALVEKAYAKLHGSYEALAGGHALEAFVDLTGGLAEKLETTGDFFPRLRIAFTHGAFITCARKGEQSQGEDNEEVPDKEVDGLVQGHAYTVTHVERLEVNSLGIVKLVRLRNPWGDANEWSGAWCDSDVRWEYVDEPTKRRLGVTAMADGEFWMEFHEFQQGFNEVTIATLGPDFDLDGATDAAEQVKIVHDEWIPNQSAGGSRNDLEKFATNPQYLLTVTEPDDVDPEGEDNTPTQCSTLVGLMQEHRRSERSREMRMLGIAFFIYKTDTPSERLTSEYFLCVPEEGSSGPFTNSREVLARFELEPGSYVIIPATFYSGRARNFMIRVFALKPFTLKELPS